MWREKNIERKETKRRQVERGKIIRRKKQKKKNGSEGGNGCCRIRGLKKIKKKED